MGVHCLVFLASQLCAVRFDAYGFLHLLVFNHPFHITCMKDMVSFHTYVMANLKHDLFLCHVLAAHYGHYDDNQL